MGHGNVTTNLTVNNSDRRFSLDIENASKLPSTPKEIFSSNIPFLFRNSEIKLVLFGRTLTVT